MLQRFSRPDRYLARCGRLEAAVTEHRLDDAPAFTRGLKALFVSDTHLLPSTTDAELIAFIEKLRAQEPDMLLLGGDYSDTTEGAVRFFEALRGFSPRLGTFGVLGNNDAEAWEGRFDALRAAMAQAGCELLINEARRLELNGGTLHIAGVDEFKLGQPDAQRLYPDSPGPGCYRVLLSHFPCEVSPTPDLMLSGHTHGGQFNLLGLTPFVVGFEQLFHDRRASLAIAGLHPMGAGKLLVSKGVGASRIQLRVGVRPEVNLIRFG